MSDKLEGEWVHFPETETTWESWDYVVDGKAIGSVSRIDGTYDALIINPPVEPGAIYDSPGNENCLACFLDNLDMAKLAVEDAILEVRNAE